jgi:tungstate transport system substrate-binding protein
MKMSRWSQRRTKIAIAAAIIVVLGVTVGLAAWEYGRPRLILATTTSTYDSGLLDYLLPEFENRYLVKVDIVSVGTGQAIATAQSGDADVLLVHSRAAEDQFVHDGYGVHRVCVMYNDFIIIGPSSDPAGILGQTSAKTAFKKIAAAGDTGNAIFISRGDNSGTHNKEMAIWDQAGIDPVSESWYVETGQGMGDTLTVTDQQQAYCLVDRGTWLSKKNTLELVVLSEGDQILLNPYGMIQINPNMYPDLNHEMAQNLVAFMISEAGQQKIASYTVGGEILFKPLYGKCASITGCTTQSAELAYWGPISGNYGTASIATCEGCCCHH